MTLAESIELLVLTINKKLIFLTNMSDKSRTVITKYDIFSQTLNGVLLAYFTTY